MPAAAFDFAPLLPAGLPQAAARWTGHARYSFVGGNIDPEQVPVDGLIDAINAGAEAVLCASIFHYGHHTVEEVKEHLAAAGIPVRLE